jgi:signal transduction histidine kinase/HAMP domain-containing protein
MSFFRFRSLRSKLLLAGLLFQTLLLGGYFLVTSDVLRNGIVRNLEVTAQYTSDILNLAIAPYAADNRLADVEDFLQELTGAADNSLTYVLILDDKGNRLLSAGKPPSRPLPVQHDLQAALNQGQLHQQQPILLGGNQVGQLRFGLATGNLLDILKRMLQRVLALNFVALVLAAIALHWFSLRLDRRLKSLMQATDALTAGDYQHPVNEQGDDELARLASNFNRMAEAVTSREKKFTSVFNAAPLPMLLLAERGEHLLIEQSNSAADQQLPLQSVMSSLRKHWQALPHTASEIAQVLNREVQLPVLAGGEHAFLLSSKSFDLPEQRYQIIALMDFQELRTIQLELLALNNSLEQRIKDRTAELAGRNEELARALTNLQLMQEQLVQADKLSSLGSIVAAVAHELNTPIGNALTVATTLQDVNKAFSRAIEHGLRRTVLDEFQSNTMQAADILQRNLQRAAELIASFKGVAVDRTSSQRRVFVLADVVQETLTTLAPTLKQMPYKIDCQIASNIHLDSYPGPLGQILSNLINNAIVHAFSQRDHGLIVIRAEMAQNDQLRLTFRDDGCGIAPEHLKRIFDPFFTTRLGQGGSGLGLNIVYNLATGLLGGTIHAESQLGSGTCFTLEIPLQAPRAEEPTND